MKSYIIRGLVLAGVFILLLPSLGLCVPQIINYQGRVLDDTGVPVSDGAYSIEFRLYSTPTGGSPMWSDTQSLDLVSGRFTTELAVPASNFATDDLYVSVWVEGSEITDRQRLTTVAFSYRAGEADSADFAATAGSADSATSSTDSLKLNGKDAAWYAAASHEHDADYVNEVDHTKAAHDLMDIDADLVDSMHAADIIDAASDEVRIPISSVPFTITTSMSGKSFYFTGDLTYTLTSGTAIEVKGNDVTIDMMGYALAGVGSGNSTGIYLTASVPTNVEIRNGTVRKFGGTGIVASSGTGNRVINVRCVNNGSYGIALLGYNQTIKGCSVSGNGGYGCIASYRSLITDTTAYMNGDAGLMAFSESTISNCVSNDNSGNGIVCNGVVTGCSANYNSQNGISGDGTISNNYVANNVQCGIISNNSLIINNTANYNNQANNTNYAGIRAGYRCIVKENSLYNNKQNNILVYSTQNVIEQNLVTNSNPGNGIKFNSASNYYRDNRASGNGVNFTGSLPVGNSDGGGNVSF